jgi:predicted O-methyltransferase YrrM
MLVFSRLCDPQATIITVDLPDEGQALRPSVIPRLRQPRRRLHFLRNDSHSRSTLETASSILGGEMTDFLFIDSDDTYGGGVKQDFEMYSPLVRSGRMVAFHDIAEGPCHPDSQVGRFRNEIKPRHRHVEMIEDPAQGWAGIGVCFV